MDRTQILVVGRNKDIVPVLQRLIDKNEHWQCSVAYEDEEAILAFQQMQYDIVLLSSGIEAASESKLCSIFRFQQPEIIILQHYGGGGGLLENEIRHALEQRDATNKARFNFFNGLFN
jgi:PleD family two-component response regulator